MVHKEDVVAFFVDDKDGVVHFVQHAAFSQVLLGNAPVAEQLQLVRLPQLAVKTAVLRLSVRFGTVQRQVSLLEHALEIGALKAVDDDTDGGGNLQLLTVDAKAERQLFTQPGGNFSNPLFAGNILKENGKFITAKPPGQAAAVEIRPQYAPDFLQ